MSRIAARTTARARADLFILFSPFAALRHGVDSVKVSPILHARLYAQRATHPPATARRIERFARVLVLCLDRRGRCPALPDPEASFPPHGAARRGHCARAAVSRVDASGWRPQRVRGGRTAHSPGLHLHSARLRDGPVDAGGDRPRLRLHATLQSLEPYRSRLNVVSGLKLPAAYVGELVGGRESRALVAVLAHLLSRGRRTVADVGRSARSAAHRSGNAVAVARARARSGLVDLVSDSANAAADGDESARRVRALTRRRQHARGARGAATAALEPARFRDGSSRRTAARSARARPAAHGSLFDRRARARAPTGARRGFVARRPRRARQTERHPGRLRRARDADVRFAGARLGRGSDAHLNVHGFPRAQQSSVPEERRQRRIPQRVASLRCSREPRSAREAERVPHADDDRVFPTQARGHSRRRRQPARSLADRVRQRHGESQSARSRPVADARRRRRLRPHSKAGGTSAPPTALRSQTCSSRC